MIPHLRIARPVSDLERAARMYAQGLDFRELGRFADHEGFDGVMVGLPGAQYHFEFTLCRGHPVRPAPTAEDLAVLYVPGDEEWDHRCVAMRDAGFVEVPSFNPYWAQRGRTFEDFDGYRVVIERSAWPGEPAAPAQAVTPDAKVAAPWNRAMRALDASPLVLEPLTAAHAHEMFPVLSDPAIYEFENEPPASEDALARRYATLERRASPDGSEAWLNWAVRRADGQLAGYVQATVRANGVALVAYELGSRHWRQGVATRAVSAMLDELRARYGARLFVAVLKARNGRSLGLLRKLAFVPADDAERARFHAGDDELVMMRVASPSQATG